MYCNQIQVYFNNDDLDPVKAVNSAFYRLVFTNDTVNNTDDVVYTPTQVEYDAQRDLVVLTFADDIEKLSSGEGTYRLRIGTDEIITDTPVEITPAEDPGSSFATANDLGTLVPGAKLVTAAIDPNLHPLEFPGSNDEPGHRQTKDETHLLGVADATPGITTIAYNFMEVYGQDSFGNDLFNLVTENQKMRAREIFELYGSYLGVQFEETEGDGIIVVTGDMRELDDTLAVERGGVLGVAGFQQVTNQPMIILDSLERWDDSFGETIEPNRFSWMEVAMHEIGHILGMGHTTDVNPYSVMSGQIEGTQTQFDAFVTNFEKTFPGPIDIVHGQHLFRPESNDIDMYRVVLPERGSLSVEVIAERQADSSALDSYLTLYREQNGRRIRIAGNDDYFSEDALIELELAAGTYFVAVTSTGNDNIDPTVEDSGFGGTSEGPYQLRVDYRPQVDNVLTDATGTLFDGDADGIQGGVYDFWFRAVGQDKTTYVDKAASPGGDGSLAAPFQNLRIATTGANTPQPGEVLRIVGNGGADGDLLTLGDNLAYEIGNSGGRLADGSSLEIPAGVSAIVDAGAIFKMLNSNIHVGSSAVGIDRSESSLQILGTPEAAVLFTSYDDQSIGVDTNPRITTPDPGDWGGLIFQNDIDRKEGRFDFEQEGIFLNFVNQADIRYGGGNVVVDSVQTVVAPIHMVNARPTVSYNTIQFSADAALSANPNSFEESTYTAVDSFGIHYQASLFTPDYRRVGPDIRGNRLVDNSINGLFTRIETPAGDALEKLTVTGRWDDADIVHVVSENLTIQGTPGGPLVDAASGMRVARMDASLKIDPKLVVKLDGSRIEATLGAQLLAEGNAGQSIIFTSLLDDRYGAGGMFQTSAPDADSMDAAAAGDWGGIYIGPVARGSLDHAVIAFGGGLTRMEGSFAGFNAVETHQGELRITNSLFQDNAHGLGGQGELTREGRGINASGAIFVRGAQPILVDNVIRGTEGYRAGVINIDVNSLNQDLVRDLGRATGLANAHAEILENQGPLIQGNRLADNSLNGMIVRGGAVATESVWDDTDIVHILFDEVTVSNFHTYGGVRLESSPTESLVVKMLGNQAGFQATGRAREIEDRIGGVVQVIGQPGRPVVLTSLDDNTVGAGLDPHGRPQNETNGNARVSRQNPRGTFQIDLNYGPLATARPEIVSALEEAARVWEELLEDPITVTLDVELADLGDGTLGVSQPDFVGVPYDQVRTALINDARSHEAIVNDLPTFAELNASVPADTLNPFVLQPTMRLTSANARALGLPAAGAASLYDPTETRDGLIQFNLHPTILAGPEPSFFDYDRSDGIQPNYDDFIATAIHEIGHSLGFLSAVDDVAAGQRNIELNTLDLYRLEPGRGQDDFRNAARAIDPALTHVFYDGGNFDPIGYPIAGLTRGDIPLSNSVGDQASHWLEFPATLGLMDPQSEPGEEANLNENDRTAFDLIGWDVTGDGHAGDWVGILLDQYSHDRNVVTVTEFESPASVAPGNNATPLAAQYLGSLGQGEKDSDETLRLGFTVHGVIHQARDVDVYSFEAKAGTEVWFDIDRTSSTLDSVVELVDSTGRVLAQSDNSIDDSLFQTIATGANGIQVRGLQKSLFQPKDHFSTNPKDAGLRVVLPGQVGATGTYFVRIRSASGNLSSTTNGQTAGAYQLQIRLSEVDEVGGSSVKFADIRYARDGVRIKGLPAHSPLTGEISEEPFDQNNEVAIPNFARDLARPPVFPPAAIDFTDAQNVGNLLNTDRATITIAGSVDVPNGDNVDFYKFEVGTDSVQQAGALIDVIIDLDYADGLARADLNLFVYEDANPGKKVRWRNLLFMGNPNSSITEDSPYPEMVSTIFLEEPWAVWIPTWALWHWRRVLISWLSRRTGLPNWISLPLDCR
ncbi:MAG: NF038122 family metalloprotease [Pirellulaceae bacterium]